MPEGFAIVMPEISTASSFPLEWISQISGHALPFPFSLNHTLVANMLGPARQSLAPKNSRRLISGLISTRHKARHNGDPVTVRGDNPIRRPEDDTLGRKAAARSFGKQVLGLQMHFACVFASRACSSRGFPKEVL